MDSIILPKKLVYNYEINWNLHRSCSSKDNINTILKNQEYQVDYETNKIIIQKPKWEHSPYAI